VGLCFLAAVWRPEVWRNRPPSTPTIVATLNGLALYCIAGGGELKSYKALKKKDYFSENWPVLHPSMSWAPGFVPKIDIVECDSLLESGLAAANMQETQK
jgi:hypothetical protein